LVEPGQALDAEDIKQKVDEHIKELTKRIETDLGSKVLPVKQGAAASANV
jgi:hypothetical protein